MDGVMTTVLPTFLVVLMSGVLLSCFCWRRHNRDRVKSPSKLRSESEKRSSYQLSDDLKDDESHEPHPFLPRSLYSGTAKISTLSYGPCDTYPENVGLLESSYMVSNTCVGVSHILLRQESNSHRNCGLPPVPSGPDYQDPNSLLSGKQSGVSGSDVTEQLLAPEPQMSTMATFTVSQVTANEALISCLSFSDDPQSESDGLYASVGHSGAGCSSVSRENIPRDSNSVPPRSNKTEEHRQSVTDSAHAPYYSSVVSVVGCPTDYGDICGLAPLRNQSTPPLPDQPHQNCDLYARVRPRTERLPQQTLKCHDSSISIPISSGSSENYSRPLAPLTGVSTTVGLDEPPIPERGYGSSAIEMVHQTRLVSGPGYGTESQEYPSTSNRPSASPDSNVPLIRRLLNAIQLINARHYHYSGHASDSSGSRSNQSTSGPYRKITVRESLASLRARNALPPVEPLPISTELQYEHIYGVHGESNCSATYEVVADAGSSNPVPISEVMASSGEGAVHQFAEGQSRRLSDIYSEIPYTTCYALTFASPPGASRSSSERVRTLDEETPLSRNTSERRYKSSVSDVLTPSTVFGSMGRSDHTSTVSPIVNNGFETTAFVLAEMQAFRHMDSEVDLTYARVHPMEAGDLRNSHNTIDDLATQANSSTTVTRSTSQSNCKAMPSTSAERCAASSLAPGLPVNESFINHNLMPPLMERSMEEGSLQCPSHPNTPSISSSALSNLLNENEPVALHDSKNHHSNGTHINTNRGLIGCGSTTDHPEFDYMLARMSSSEATQWLQACELNGSDPVTYDDVALS